MLYRRWLIFVGAIVALIVWAFPLPLALSPQAHAYPPGPCAYLDENGPSIQSFDEIAEKMWNSGWAELGGAAAGKVLRQYIEGMCPEYLDALAIWTKS